MPLRLGKLPATHDPRDLVLGTYLADTVVLPQIPASVGHYQLLPKSGWGMLGNDEYGDCAWAGPAHETMLWTKLGGHAATFTTADVLADYAAGTGFDPNAGPPGANPTDQGSNVRDVANYRRKTGIVDAHGHRHKIGAYVAVHPDNFAHCRAAVYLFGALGIGFQVPQSAMTQFENHQPWDVVPGSPVEGGHYVPVLGIDPVYLYVVTWGRIQVMTRRFFATYCDEAYAYLSVEQLTNGKSPEGFNLAQLTADLPAVKS